MDEETRILVVDDDDAIRRAYREILTDSKQDLLKEGGRLFGSEGGITSKRFSCSHLEEAENGHKGVELVRRAMEKGTPFQAAFIDMKMPGMNGAETTREICRMDPRIKIVIATAYSDVPPQEIVQTADREDIFYLQKPFSPQEILQFARALCRQWSLEKERDRLSRDLGEANKALAELNRTLKDKVAQRTRMLRVRNEILEMMINDLNFEMIIERICGETAEDFGLDVLFVEVPFMKKVFSSQPDKAPSGDLIRASKIARDTTAKVHEAFGCAVPLMRDDVVLGICLFHDPILLGKEAGGWFSLLTLALIQARSLEESPELMASIDRLMGDL